MKGCFVKLPLFLLQGPGMVPPEWPSRPWNLGRCLQKHFCKRPRSWRSCAMRSWCSSMLWCPRSLFTLWLNTCAKVSLWGIKGYARNVGSWAWLFLFSWTVSKWSEQNWMVKKSMAESKPLPSPYLYHSILASIGSTWNMRWSAGYYPRTKSQMWVVWFLQCLQHFDERYGQLGIQQSLTMLLQDW